MAFTRNAVTMRDRFKAFTDYQEFLKKELEECITAPHFTLEQRWQMFVDAPAELSNHEGWIYHGFDKILAPELDRINWIADTDLFEKAETVNTVELVDEYFAKAEEYGIIYSGIDEEGFLDKIKEQILKDNIKSYKFDW
jgi:hypothetical protein